VANAVLDGVDGIMLGAETLRGKFCQETVSTIRAICGQAEQVFDHNYHFEHLMDAAVQANEPSGGWCAALHASGSMSP
jgi:pyruvate kinase